MTPGSGVAPRPVRWPWIAAAVAGAIVVVAVSLAQPPATLPQVTLDIRTQPPGAQVVIDGIVAGETPLRQAVAASGRALEVRISRPGFVPVVRLLSPAADTTLELELQALPAK